MRGGSRLPGPIWVRALFRVALSAATMPGFARRAIPSPDRRAALSQFRPVAASRSLHQLSQLGVLEAYGARGHLRDQRAAVPIHEAAAQDQILEPAPRRGAPHRAS